MNHACWTKLSWYFPGFWCIQSWLYASLVLALVELVASMAWGNLKTQVHPVLLMLTGHTSGDSRKFDVVNTCRSLVTLIHRSKWQKKNCFLQIVHVKFCQYMTYQKQHPCHFSRHVSNQKAVEEHLLGPQLAWTTRPELPRGWFLSDPCRRGLRYLQQTLPSSVELFFCAIFLHFFLHCSFWPSKYAISLHRPRAWPVISRPNREAHCFLSFVFTVPAGKCKWAWKKAPFVSCFTLPILRLHKWTPLLYVYCFCFTMFLWNGSISLRLRNHPLPEPGGHP